MPMLAPRMRSRSRSGLPSNSSLRKSGETAGAAVGSQQAERCHHELALARARLADDGERLTLGDIDGDAADGVYRAAGGGEVDLEIADG